MVAVIRDKKGSIWYGIMAIIMVVFITVISFIPILFFGLLKLIPIQAWQVRCTKSVDVIAQFWIDFTTGYVQRFYPVQWNVEGLTQYNPKQWHLLIANHQSWLDTIILQNIFNHRIPALKCFIKDQLKWVPLLGFSWWAMGCPFMKRYSKAFLDKYPHKKGKDIEATKKALSLLKSYPCTLISFVEGTRYTLSKKRHQQSPYEYLLKPKAGGISHVVSAMGQKLQNIIDVTIVYPTQRLSLWDFLCRRMDRVYINIRSLNIPETLTQSSDWLNDQHKIELFRSWLNEQWVKKDAIIESMKQKAAAEPPLISST